MLELRAPPSFYLLDTTSLYAIVRGDLDLHSDLKEMP